ncbi:MAG: histidine--tRNA ligase [Alphaproteobacteria bacterium]
MSLLQPVRGTQDLLPDAIRRHRHVEKEALRVAGLYGFSEIATPIFEFTEVFSRTLGETSDIVSKEMYTFNLAGESLTLRPEGTAGVARAFISNGLTQQLPLKLFYSGPMFRYERPQKGRQRQFHQIGVELLGVDSPEADIEVIALGQQVLDRLGLKDKVVLEMNTLGDAASRAAYREALVAYLSGHVDRLSEESRARLGRNPLRVLDSKDEGDRRVVAGAPLFPDFLNQPSLAFFDRLRQGLDDLGIAYEVNPRLVRGLDYYCHTAFEFTTTALGAQGTVLAGGRYDNLIQQMGGPPTPGIGWAAGVERLAMMLITEGESEIRPIVVIPMGGEDGQRQALIVTQKLRQSGFVTDLGYSGSMAKRMKRANRDRARVAVILGEEEQKRGNVLVRDLDSGEQQEIPLISLEEHLASCRYGS